jgi:hypothetical protein
MANDQAPMANAQAGTFLPRPVLRERAGERAELRVRVQRAHSNDLGHWTWVIRILLVIGTWSLVISFCPLRLD